MTYLKIPTSVARSPEFIRSDPVQRATWFALVIWCAEQVQPEKPSRGIIVGCMKWKDRTWQQLCGVTESEVKTKSELWRWEGENLVVNHYPASAETEYLGRVAGAIKGGQSRAAMQPATPQPEGKPQAMPQAMGEAMGEAMPQDEPEGKLQPKLINVLIDQCTDSSINQCTHQVSTGAPNGAVQRGFHKPTLDELKLQCAKIGLPEQEAENFLNYYTANGWRVGRNPMKSWPHALANWKAHWETNRGRNHQVADHSKGF